MESKFAEGDVLAINDEWTNETQIERNEIGYQIDDKTTIIHLSQMVNGITSKLIKIVVNIGASHANDLEDLTDPLKDVISFVWSTPMDESFQENLYFLFDKLLDIVYCIYEVLENVWHESAYIIESKLSQISLHILQVVDEMNTLSESKSHEFDTKLTKIKESIVELTVSIVGLTSITTSIAQSITTRVRDVEVIGTTIASLMIIHQYAVAAAACLLSRAVKVINSFDLMHSAGIPVLEATIINFITNLEPILMNNVKEATMTHLFHGDLHTKLSIQLLISMHGLTGNKMINLINTSTTSLMNIIHEYAPKTFHILPDLLSQLTVILVRCSHTEFRKMEQFLTYAFDGLYDVLHHISYNLDRHIQSSASTGSFSEPSEPIDVCVGNVRAATKRLIHDSQHKNELHPNLIINLIESTSDLLRVLLDPMNIVVNKSDSDFSITLTASLQFIALYVIGLAATPFISAVKGLQGIIGTNSEMYSHFSATLSLALIKIQMIFDYSKVESAMEALKRLYDNFVDLLQDLTQLIDGDTKSSRETRRHAKANDVLNLSDLSSINKRKTSSL